MAELKERLHGSYLYVRPAKYGTDSVMVNVMDLNKDIFQMVQVMKSEMESRNLGVATTVEERIAVLLDPRPKYQSSITEDDAATEHAFKELKEGFEKRFGRAAAQQPET